MNRRVDTYTEHGFQKGRLGLVIILLSWSFRLAYAQQKNYDQGVEMLLEEIVTPQNEEVDYATQYELLSQWYVQPLNLNEATTEELQQLYVLSERQISNLLQQRVLYGDFMTLNELLYIPAWDQATIFRIMPFVTTAPVPEQLPTWSERLAAADHLFMIRHETTLEPKEGYIRADTMKQDQALSHYAGSPHKLYTRWQMSHRHDFSVGITAEKDAGEQWGWHPEHRRYGMDYYAAHLQLENRGWLRQLTVGDYRIQAGQGLVLGGGFLMGKGAEPVRTLGRTEHRVRPHTAATENGFWRGIATTVRLPTLESYWELTTFGSFQRQDARLDSTGGYFESIQTTGLHRTASERSARRQLRERTIGGSLLFRDESRHWQAGVTYVHTRFSYPWQPDEQLRNRHEFFGKTNDIVGVFANYRAHPVHAFGEVARSKSGGLGAVGGATWHLSSMAEAAVLLRHYSPRFHSLYGNAFRENARNINEQGLYWGLTLRPWKRLTVASYYDRFRFPWLRYRVDAPSDGYEFFTRLHYPFSARTESWLQYRQESKAINVDADHITRVLPGVKRSVGWNFVHHINDGVRLRTRVQSSTYRLYDKTTHGFTIAQDVSATQGRWKADLRLALFDTDDFINRQYVYENDVLYAFAISAYSGSGVRNYLVVRYKANRHLSVWAKVARTTYHDGRTEVGSSLEAIAGQAKTDVKFQLIVKW